MKTHWVRTKPSIISYLLHNKILPIAQQDFDLERFIIRGELDPEVYASKILLKADSLPIHRARSQVD